MTCSGDFSPIFVDYFARMLQVKYDIGAVSVRDTPPASMTAYGPGNNAWTLKTDLRDKDSNLD